jgi:hypothetical protein
MEQAHLEPISTDFCPGCQENAGGGGAGAGASGNALAPRWRVSWALAAVRDWTSPFGVMQGGWNGEV